MNTPSQKMRSSQVRRLVSTLPALVVFLLSALPAAPQSAPNPSLVADLDTTGEPYTLPCILSVCPPPSFFYGARLSQLTGLGGHLYFLADDREHGLELWRTEGTPETTILVQDTAPGPPSSNPTILGATDQYLLFWSETPEARLWSTTNAASGATAIAVDCPGCGSAEPILKAPFEGWILFQLYDPNRQHYVLFGSNGTDAVEIADLCDRPGFCLERVAFALEWQGALFFDHSFPGHARPVFRLDSPMTEPIPVHPGCTWGQRLAAVDDQLLFTGSCYDAPADLFRNGLYSTATLEQEPSLLVPFATFPSGGGGGTTGPLPERLTPFAGDRAAFVVEPWLWLTDGTASGTRPLQPLQQVDAMVALEDRLLVSGRHFDRDGLWTIDRSGTVTNVAELSAITIPEVTHPAGMGPRAFFAADEGGLGAEPWMTDGTVAGTRRLSDLNPGPNGSDPGIGGDQPTGFVAAGDRTYFGADDGTHDVELWAFDHRDSAPSNLCLPDSSTLCLQDGRFSVTVHWVDFDNRQGSGVAIPISVESGAFWFFEDVRYELIVKIVDGRSNNGYFWIFHGSLTNVEYDLTVTDTLTGQTWSRHNPLGSFGSDGDTKAFPGQ